MECWEHGDYCFHFARKKFGFLCQNCGIDQEGAKKAKMPGTGQRRFLCAACFWDSRVDPAMEWCPCVDNAHYRKLHNEQRARWRAATTQKESPRSGSGGIRNNVEG